jgi:methanogenic corrinoid protein MtbC1
VAESSAEIGLVVEMIREAPRAFGAHAAELLLERHPEAGSAFGPGAFRHWQEHLSQRALEVASALEVGETGLFRAQVEWTRDAFEARGVDAEIIRQSLAALADALRTDLPDAGGEAAGAVVDAAIEEMASGDDAPAAPEPANLEALRYLEMALGGDRVGARDLVVEKLAGGQSLREVYEKVLLPAQVEIGSMWHLGELSIAEEHLATETTRYVMGVAADRARRVTATSRGKVLVAVTQGDTHDMGARAVTDLLDAAGFSVFSLGADVPVPDVASAVQMFGPDALVLAATIGLHLRRLGETIDAVRAVRPDLLIVAGGPALMLAPDLAAKLGADVLARSPGEAVDVIEERVGGVGAA